MTASAARNQPAVGSPNKNCNNNCAPFCAPFADSRSPSAPELFTAAGANGVQGTSATAGTSNTPNSGAVSQGQVDTNTQGSMTTQLPAQGNTE